MKPAFSVIFFTTLSGAGYGMLFWLGLHYAWQPLPLSREFALILFALALALVSIGLFSSLLHLGRPARAWRALSQWQSSWLSREGMLAMTSYAPALGLMALIWLGALALPAQALGGLLALMALATVSATAMIYASLRTVPAWHDWRVLPVYLLYALLSGGLIVMTLLSLTGWRPSIAVSYIAAASLLALAGLKLSYWLSINTDQPVDRASAVGLPAGSDVRAFERPHTEQSFITREMGFVLARKHARVLRLIAIVMSALLPLLALLIGTRLVSLSSVLAGAAAAILFGAVIERWLFFAEARHVVMRYYP
ncbi:MAG: DMSO reductase [Gammaproteobacteria bacterium HGW-Gammaproteobacteria-4]|jgi:DMSO reductase anchor subunit|nr:MAG: DMSO reductase [Gammaproteobacteria bacterium HGW-Gammaproteobacteria-4]